MEAVGDCWQQSHRRICIAALIRARTVMLGQQVRALDGEYRKVPVAHVKAMNTLLGARRLERGPMTGERARGYLIYASLRR